MTSQFNWNTPPAAGATPAAPSAPAPVGFGGPAARPIDAAQALAGFGEAPIDTRDPFLPLGFAGVVRIDKTEGKTSRNIGYAIYISCTVTRVANAGGGALSGALPKGANLGGKYVMRIDGFGSADAKAFAFSDLKQFMIAALESKGLTPAIAATLPPEEWNKMGTACGAGNLGADGCEIAVQAGMVDTKAGFKKQKTLFYPLSAVAG
jgi:hypothetical protein